MFSAFRFLTQATVREIIVFHCCNKKKKKIKGNVLFYVLSKPYQLKTQRPLVQNLQVYAITIFYFFFTRNHYILLNYMI